MATTPFPLRTFGKTAGLIAEGARWLPGGASSDYRMGTSALVIDHAEGALLFDVDGNRLIDYYLGAGPIILGHDAPVVIEAVTRQMQRGVQLGGETVEEYEAARLVTEIVPWAEMVRFANTGSEAVQLAFRIARGATGRDTVVKFEGHYHGWLDCVFVGLPGRPNVAPAATSGSRTSSAGQDPAAIEHTEVLPWNDLDAVEARLARGDVAAVITEPLWRGYIRPAAGLSRRAARGLTRHGVVLIFDEIVSGFRAGLGGGQGLFGVLPDLTTFAKAMANGFIISAVAGRRDLMSLIGGGAGHPSGDVQRQRAVDGGRRRHADDARTGIAPREHRAGRRPADRRLLRRSDDAASRASCRACPGRSTSTWASIGRSSPSPTRWTATASAARRCRGALLSAAFGRSRAGTGTCLRPTRTTSSTRRSTSSRTPCATSDRPPTRFGCQTEEVPCPDPPGPRCSRCRAPTRSSTTRRRDPSAL